MSTYVLQTVNYLDPRLLAIAGGVVRCFSTIYFHPVREPDPFFRFIAFMSTLTPYAAIWAWLLSSLLLSHRMPIIAAPLARAWALHCPSHSAWLLTTVFRWLLRLSLGVSPLSTRSQGFLGEFYISLMYYNFGY